MFIYALKSAIVLSLLYLPYLLMLHHESLFRFNRKMLCGILVASLILPFCNLPALSLDANPVVNAARQQMIEVGIPIAQGLAPEGEETQQYSWFAIVATLYMTVAVVLLVIRLRDYVRLQRIIRRDCLWRKEQDGITIYCHAEDIPPFSWGRTIVIGRNDYERNGACIIRHETGHIISGHSWDVLLLTAVQLVQWFNPLVWLMGQSLQDVHEYEADDYVLRGGITLDEYRYLLIQKAVGASPYVLANNFNHSLLKKRIKMMCKKKSSPWQRAKALYTIPVALLALSAFATPEFKNASQAIDEHIVINGKASTEKEMQQLNPADIENVTVMKGEQATALYGDKGKDGAIVINTKKQPEATPDDTDDRVFDICEELPTYPGGEAAMMQFLIKNVRYPQAAIECGETGRILVQFIVEKDGSLSSFKAFDGKEEIDGGTHEITVNAYAADGRELTAEEIAAKKESIKAARQAMKDEAVRVVKLMPHWAAGKQRGKAVRVKLLIPITFRLS